MKSQVVSKEKNLHNLNMCQFEQRKAVKNSPPSSPAVVRLLTATGSSSYVLGCMIRLLQKCALLFASFAYQIQSVI